MPLRITCLLLLSFVCLAGCNSNNKGKIEGTKWVNEPMTFEGKRLRAGILRLEFDKDGTLRFGLAMAMKKGTYKLAGGDTVIMKFDTEVSGRKTHHEKITVSGDSLTMTDTDGKSLKFKRVKSGSGNKTGSR